MEPDATSPSAEPPTAAAEVRCREPEAGCGFGVVAEELMPRRFGSAFISASKPRR